jgi:hypothetical protein
MGMPSPRQSGRPCRRQKRAFTLSTLLHKHALGRSQATSRLLQARIPMLYAPRAYDPASTQSADSISVLFEVMAAPTL